MSATSDATKALSATNTKTNFCRLSRLVIVGGTRVLREVLDKFHPPASLGTVLASPAVEADLRKLPKAFQDILYPARGTYGKSDDFDITILVRLLKCACNLPAPATGWTDEPPEADLSLSADLVRIRILRNKMAHTGDKMEVQDEDFVSTWGDLKGVLTRLAGFVSANSATEWEEAIDKMLTSPLTKEEERYAEELKTWFLQDIEVKKQLQSVDENLSSKLDEVLNRQDLILSKIDEIKTTDENKEAAEKVLELPPEKHEERPLRLRDLSLAEFNMEDIGTSTSDGSCEEQKELTLREYQKELAEEALQGKNCIICSPTGSGKTIVALYIAWRRLEQQETEEAAECSHKKGKVLFVVNRIHLTSQQQKQFQTYLPKKYRVARMSSELSETLDSVLEINDVVVSTAQIVADALKDGSVKLSEISLLIFDECHHTYAAHSYNQIMNHYLCLKLQPSASADTTSSLLPQVIGLSASLGVGEARNIPAAAEHIIHICSTMDAQKLITVERNKDELEKYTSIPDVILHRVAKQENNKFESAVVDVMSTIERKVMKFSVPELRTNERGEQPYRNWIEEAAATAIGNRVLMSCLDHLRQYHIALNIADVSRMSDAQNYLKRYFQGQDENKFTDIDRFLVSLFEKMEKEIEDYIEKNGKPSNPKLHKIKEFIKSFHAEDDKSRGILFTRTRESTLALESWIKETEDLKDQIKAARITGTASQTASEQQSVIRDFDKGIVNLLIATTVAEEGLNIPECNYVIRLDMPGNEISTAQARGRVRTMQGRYIAIGGDSSRFVDKEKVNLLKGALMVRAVGYVKEMSEKTFLEKVKEQQLCEIQQRALEQQKTKLIRSQFQAEDVTFYCKKCGVLVCQAHDFRLLHNTYYVVVTQEIQDKITVKSHHSPWKTKGVEAREKVFCRNCGEDFGNTVTADGVTLPCFKIQSFALVMSDGSKRTFKKWSKRPFEVAPAEFSDLLGLY